VYSGFKIVTANDIRLTTLPPSYAHYLEIWEPQPAGNLRACPGFFTADDKA
jgi:hypothetical protein